MMKLSRVAALSAIALMGAFNLAAQTNTLTATTLSAAVAATDKTIFVTSATNINAPNLQNSTVGTELYVVAIGQPRGEVMMVTSVSSTTIGVRRTNGGAATSFPNGSLVLVGQPDWFYDYDPSGGCTTATTPVAPWVNTKTGNQWLCSTITLSWVPGWQNTEPPQVTAAVASAAGATAVNGPLQHITGTNAITSFTMGAGWLGSGFCVIPDGAFTTTATNNIAKASTAVANKTLCWAWDATNSLFTPSY